MTIRDDLISEEEWTELGQYLGLSEQQTEVVRRIFCGKSRHEIACELAIRPGTVRTQISRIYREFGVSNRVQLAVYVLASLREYWGERESLYV